MDRICIAWHGYEIVVEHMPGLIKPCLLVKPKDESCYYKVASFNSEKTTEWFIKQMEGMFGNDTQRETR